MSTNEVTPTALIADESASWRALVATVLRENGWSVVTSEGLPEPAPAAPYELLVMEPASFAGGAPDPDHLAAWARRVLLLTYLDPETLPVPAGDDPRLVGVLQKSAFHAGALLGLLQPRSEPTASPSPSAAGGPKVLVVEDDINWRELYEEILGDAGWAPYCAVSYGEARGWLQRLDFEIAIVDLNLASSAAPEGNRDGFHLLRAARQRGVPAIVVSALGDPVDVDRAYDEYGVFAFVEKEGFDRRNFRRLLEEARRAGAEEAATTAAAEPDAPASPSTGLDELTPREREVLALLIQGSTNRQIAEALLITPNTTKKHVDHILQKLGASTRAGAVAAALQSGNRLTK
jgi:DNA-binding NarL/FixJ family response regulator